MDGWKKHLRYPYHGKGDEGQVGEVVVVGGGAVGSASFILFIASLLHSFPPDLCCIILAL